MDDRTLDKYADKIEARLAQLRMPTNVVGGTRYPASGFVEFIIKPLVVDKKIVSIDSIIKAQADIANELGNSQVRVYQNRSAQICVEIQVSNPMPPSMTALTNYVRRLPNNKHVIPMGRTREGGVLTFDLNNAANAHLLICGTTGSGKTALSHAMILSACELNTPDELRVAIIDYNNPEADWFYPKIANHTGKIPTTAQEATALLKQIASKMTKRPPYKVIVFVDELAGICTESDEALEAIEFITQQGRKYGVHMIAATQKPANTIIGPILKSNMRRAVGKVASPEDSKVATGIPGSGCETLLGNGQFIYVDSEFVRFQSALPEDYGVMKPPEASMDDGDILDFKVAPEPPASGLTLINAQKAIDDLKASDVTITRAAVLRRLNYKQAGGASKILNEMWDSLVK